MILTLFVNKETGLGDKLIIQRANLVPQSTSYFY